MNKSKTVLWVLGWIFIFPLPLMILLNRRNDLNPTLKYGVIGGAWAVYLAVGIVGMMNRDPSKLSDKATVQSKVVEEKSDATTAYVPENIMEKEIKTEDVPAGTQALSPSNHQENESKHIPDRFIEERRQMPGISFGGYLKSKGKKAKRGIRNLQTIGLNIEPVPPAADRLGKYQARRDDIT